MADQHAPHAVIDWTAGTVHLDDVAIPWPIVAGGARILDEPADCCPAADGSCGRRPGVLAVAVFAKSVNLDGPRCQVVIDGHLVPWALQEAGPVIRWRRPAWEVDLPIFVERITELGTPPWLTPDASRDVTATQQEADRG